MIALCVGSVLAQEKTKDALLTPSVDGKICYTNGGDIWKMDADGSNRMLVINAGTNDIEPAWSPDGRKIVFKSDRDVPPGRGLYSVNADGTGLTLLVSGDANSDPAWSPDGTKIAFAANRDGLITSIYIMDPDGSNITRLTNQLPFSDSGPVWSPDGTRMIFETNQGLGSNIGIINLDGTGRAVIGAGRFPAWSPDGTKVVFSFPPQGSGNQLFIMNPNGTGVVQVTNGNFIDQYPAWKSDGQKIVFARNISGTIGLWTMNADGTGQASFADTNTIGNGYSDWQRDYSPVPVTVSGRVQTSSGYGIPGVFVTLSGEGGIFGAARSNSFGYFKFDAVAVQQSYTVSISNRKYQFSNTIQVVVVNDTVGNITFTATED
jgi:Tol biopolymer transport system component